MYFYCMKRITIICCLLLPFASFAQVNDSAVIKKISDEIMLHGTCYDNLKVLTKTIGNRISGSPQAQQAVAWGEAAMKTAGADSVWLQPVIVPHWIRGEEWLKIQWKQDEGFAEISMVSLGNTDGTGGKILQRQVICVNNMDEFEKLPASAVADKIIFFNYKFRQDIINTFHGYGDAVRYRWVAVDSAAKKGAAAVIIRSVSTGADDVPHAGSSRYEEGGRHIPAVAIGNESADKLAAACNSGTIHAQLLSNCKMGKPVLSYNVIGEIKGTAYPNEYITVGGHLDSWDVGEGAHDDGAGCVQSIEVLRTFKALGIHPQHSVRAVLFMNEENGAKGGQAYADSANAKNEKHIMAIESDAGGFSPRGIGLEMPDALKTRIRGWAPLFLPYGVYDFSQDESGTDISFLKKLNVPLAGLLPDNQRYFDIHHNRTDVFEAVNHRELKLGAVTMAAFIYLVDKRF